MIGSIVCRIATACYSKNLLFLGLVSTNICRSGLKDLRCSAKLVQLLSHPWLIMIRGEVLDLLLDSGRCGGEIFVIIFRTWTFNGALRCGNTEVSRSNGCGDGIVLRY